MGVDLQAHTFLEAGPDQGEDDRYATGFKLQA